MRRERDLDPGFRAARETAPFVWMQETSLRDGISRLSGFQIPLRDERRGPLSLALPFIVTGAFDTPLPPSARPALPLETQPGLNAGRLETELRIDNVAFKKIIRKLTGRRGLRL